LKPSPSLDFLSLALAAELLVAAVAALLGWWHFDDALPFVLRFDADALMLSLAGLLPLIAWVTWAMSPSGRRWPPMRRIEEVLRNMLGGELASLPLVGIVVLSAAAGLCEEWLFRGVIQERWGLVVASLVFGAAHAVTFFYFVLATLIGAYLGWLYGLSDNLFVCAAVHGLYDLYALLLLRRLYARSEKCATPGH
jgi:membrane protease YdiL (CAAX protease family)